MPYDWFECKKGCYISNTYSLSVTMHLITTSSIKWITMGCGFNSYHAVEGWRGLHRRGWGHGRDQGLCEGLCVLVALSRLT